MYDESFKGTRLEDAADWRKFWDCCSVNAACNYAGLNEELIHVVNCNYTMDSYCLWQECTL